MSGLRYAENYHPPGWSLKGQCIEDIKSGKAENKGRYLIYNVSHISREDLLDIKRECPDYDPEIILPPMFPDKTEYYIFKKTKGNIKKD